MTEPIVSLDRIAREASEAAERCVVSGLQQPNPYPVGSAAYAEFHRRYCIALMRVGTPAGECSA